MTKNELFHRCFVGILSNQTVALRKKFPYSELFWSVFSRIRTEYEYVEWFLYNKNIEMGLSLINLLKIYFILHKILKWVTSSACIKILLLQGTMCTIEK